MTEDEVVGWHHRLDGHEFEQAPGVGDGQGGLACCDSWGRKESDATGTEQERLWPSLEAQWERTCLPHGRPGFDPWVRKIPWRRKWQPTPVFLPGESHGQRRLERCSLWGHKELDTTQ